MVGESNGRGRITLKRLHRITVEAVGVCPGTAGEPEIGIVGLHLGRHPLSDHPADAVAATVVLQLLLKLQLVMGMGKGRRRRGGCVEEQERVGVVMEVAAGGGHEREGGGVICDVGAEQSTGGYHERKK